MDRDFQPTQTNVLTRRQHRPARVRPGLTGSHTRRLQNVTTPGASPIPVQEVRVEHGGVYVLSHVPRQRGEIHVAASLSRLHQAAEEVRMMLPDRYRSRVTAALVIPAEPADTDRLDLVVTVDGVLVLDEATLRQALRCAAPALSTSEVSAVESLLRERLTPLRTAPAAKQRRLHLPRLRGRRAHLTRAA